MWQNIAHYVSPYTYVFLHLPANGGICSTGGYVFIDSDSPAIVPNCLIELPILEAVIKCVIIISSPLQILTPISQVSGIALQS
jgi:hypothetical protein